MKTSSPTPSAAQLLASIQEQGFLTPLQVQQVQDKFSDARSLARELVERNWLTPYQANQLLQNRGQELLLGHYRILDRVGEGGMGQVYKAHHVSMDRTIALKMIPKERMSDATALARFQREIRAIAKLSHPNIVTAFEVNQAGQTPFLAMEYVDGIDLARLVQQSGPLSIPRACEYIRQAAVGLQHAHEKGLIHRDIKPGNLMVTRPTPEGPPVIKILDFGLARFESESAHSARLTQLGKVVGTVDYIAPEQAQDPRKADIRADIYSLGCSLFYLLTAKPPFPGEDAVEKIGARVLGDAPPVRQSRPEVSAALEQVLVKMMARDPAERFQTPGEVAKELEPYTHASSPSDTSVVVTSKRPSAVGKADSFQHLAESRAPRRLVGLLLAALVALMALLGGAVFLVRTEGSKGKTKEQALVESAPNPKPKLGQIHQFVGHTQGVVDVAFSPGGRTAVSGGDDKIVFLWDLEAGKEIRRFPGHTARITGVAFTPDGLHVLSGSEDKTVRLWNVTTGKEVRRFDHAQPVLYFVTVTSDGKRLLTSTAIEKHLHIWDLATGAKLREFEFRGGLDPKTIDVWIASCSADGKRAITAATDDHVRVWDVENATSQLLDRDVNERRAEVQDRASRGGSLSADGRFALAWGHPAKHELLVYDVPNGKLLRRFKQPAPVHHAFFSPDGKRIIACYDIEVFGALLDAETGKELFRIPGNPLGMPVIRFSPDGKRALSSGRDGSVRLWGLPD
jgi:serine/threonine protein kinase